MNTELLQRLPLFVELCRFAIEALREFVGEALREQSDRGIDSVIDEIVTVQGDLAVFISGTDNDRTSPCFSSNLLELSRDDDHDGWGSSDGSSLAYEVVRTLRTTRDNPRLWCEVTRLWKVRGGATAADELAASEIFLHWSLERAEIALDLLEELDGQAVPGIHAARDSLQVLIDASEKWFAEVSPSKIKKHADALKAFFEGAADRGVDFDEVLAEIVDEEAGYPAEDASADDDTGYDGWLTPESPGFAPSVFAEKDNEPHEHCEDLDFSLADLARWLTNDAATWICLRAAVA